MSHEELKESAVGFGFDVTWVADIVEQWGADVLPLVVEAARHGLSITLVVELLQKFGPSLLDFVVGLLNKKAFMATGEVVPGPVVEGFDAGFLDLIIEKYLPVIIDKYAPVILDKFGPQLIQAVIDMFFKNLKK